MTDQHTRRVEYLPLDQVVPATRNPKRHDLDGIRRSIDRFGFTEPALLDERTGQLVAGHGRHEALSAIREAGQHPPTGVQVDDTGAWLVPVVRGWSSRSDAEAEGYLVASNRWSELGGWDDAALAALLADVAAADEDLLAATGYDHGDLERLIGAQAVPDLSSFKSFDDIGRGPDDPDADDDETVECPSCGHTFTT
jgi:hypothetical protein